LNGAQERLKQQALTTLVRSAIVTIAAIVKLSTIMVFAAFAIAIFNSLFPWWPRLTDPEAHYSAGKQRSLYFKIARWGHGGGHTIITRSHPP
jgi:hypothetical protein